LLYPAELRDHPYRNCGAKIELFFNYLAGLSKKITFNSNKNGSTNITICIAVV